MMTSDSLRADAKRARQIVALIESRCALTIRRLTQPMERTDADPADTSVD